jgi:HEAT repeat protein
MVAPPSQPSIERVLGSSDAEERRQATAQLARLPLERALPLLLRALGDEDWRVRKEGTLAARVFSGEQRLTAALIEVLAGGDNVGLRNAAVEVLAGAGHVATAALAQALPTLDADGRKLVVETLGRARDPAAVAPLEAALADADDNVRQGAVEALAALGQLAPDRVQAILLARLQDRDRVVRLTALEGLTALGVVIPWDRLELLIEDPTLRAAALSAAALAESPEAARTLVRALGKARGSSFNQALKALARLADGPLATTIADALRAEGPELAARLVEAASSDSGGDARRTTSLRLAAAAGAEGVVDVAVAALAEERLAEPAQRALTALGAAALPAMIAHLASPAASVAPRFSSPEARAALVDVIAEIAQAAGDAGASAALGALRRAARDPDKEIAVRALLALSRLGAQGDLELAAEQTLSDARPVALAAEGALAALAGRFPEAARALADRLTRQELPSAQTLRMSHDEAFLLPAAIALGALGAAALFEERDATFLAHAATAGDTRARRAAVEAVSELRSSAGAAFPGAMEVLSLSLADEEHDVQIAAARALGRLCSAPDAPRASDVLDLVDRSGASDLVAATVRAIGEGMGPSYQGRHTAPPEPPHEDLVAALALFARGAPSGVAIAAVEALGQAQRAGARAAIEALAGALDHPDVAVVKVALLKLAAEGDGERHRGGASSGLAAVARGLEHSSPEVRALAVEMLADSDAEEAREWLVRQLLSEPDRKVKEAIQRVLAPLSSSSISLRAPLAVGSRLSPAIDDAGAVDVEAPITEPSAGTAPVDITRAALRADAPGDRRKGDA